MLLVSDIPRHLKLYDKYYSIQEQTSYIGCINISKPNFHMLKFSLLKPLFDNCVFFILILGCTSMSIIKCNNIFYIFNPHSYDKYGFPHINGNSILLTFYNFKKLCTYIENLSEILHTNSYELTPIIIYETNNLFQINIKKKHISKNSYDNDNDKKINTSKKHKLNTNKEISNNKKIKISDKEKNMHSLEYENYSEKSKSKEQNKNKISIIIKNNKRKNHSENENSLKKMKTNDSKFDNEHLSHKINISNK